MTGSRVAWRTLTTTGLSESALSMVLRVTVPGLAVVTLVCPDKGADTSSSFVRICLTSLRAIMA